MPDYEHSLTIEASPETVFDFVSDIANLPKYLPTTHHAEAQPGGRVRVQGRPEAMLTTPTATFGLMRLITA
jgi:uncharacterized protein YndB with AHSA1/START domain